MNSFLTVLDFLGGENFGVRGHLAWNPRSRVQSYPSGRATEIQPTNENSFDWLCRSHLIHHAQTQVRLQPDPPYAHQA